LQTLLLSIFAAVFAITAVVVGVLVFQPLWWIRHCRLSAECELRVADAALAQNVMEGNRGDAALLADSRKAAEILLAEWDRKLAATQKARHSMAAALSPETRTGD
jgi:hypothetical protein